VKKTSQPPLHSRLRDARQEQGWSQKQLADRIGTTHVNISRWEHGSHFPTPYFRQLLCEVFDKTLAELGLVPPPTKPPIPRIWTVPLTRNPFFTGREPLLALLHERLSTSRMAALIQPQALYGLGGIGKTQTAAEYTFRYGDEYTHVFWTHAATRETLTADFVKLAQLLNLPEKESQNLAQLISAVKGWLANNHGWLLISDNADELSLAQEFLPANHSGFVLFTTRDQAAGRIAAGIEVEQLNQQESILLLLRCSKRLGRDVDLRQVEAEDSAIAERIVEEMDGLPLAIVQAGSYIEESGCSLTDYLRLYKAHRKVLLARRSRFALDYPNSVATTWSISFRRVEQQNNDAAHILSLCAFLAPDAIPEELLMQGIAQMDADSTTDASDPFRLNQALEVLRRHSLVRRDLSTHTLSIHRLVQTVLKDNMDQDTQRVWAERAIQAVNAAFPNVGSDEGQHQQYYLPHIQECSALISQYHLDSQEAANLLFRAGDFLYFHGFYAQSQSFHQQGLAIREQIFGSEHPDVAESLNRLAILASTQGDYERAERFYQQALAIREKTLGPQHPSTAESLNNLSVLYRTQGKYEQAEPLLLQALNIHEQSLGAEHPKTLTLVINLSKLYQEQRKYEQAEQLLCQALETAELVLGPEHPLVAHNLRMQARIAFEQGQHERAEFLWSRSLAILEKTLGSEHPAAAERLRDLAELYVALGRYSDARDFCQRALSIYEKRFGPEHLVTIAAHEYLNRIMSKITGEQDD
jgi:tetratricopeptide (TPR) repeat protein/transcriptional regulator with XRE-family HTH domain